MGNKAICKFTDNNFEDIILYFKGLGYKWSDFVQIQGETLNSWVSLSLSDGSLAELKNGDYIVYDCETKQFTKEKNKIRKVIWTFIGMATKGRKFKTNQLN